MTYQDNLLSEQNAKDGHRVTIVTDCQKFENGVLVHTETENKKLSDGVRLIRLEYDKIINGFISGKIRKVSALSSLIMQVAPDVLMFHGCCGYELLTAAKYKKNHPEIKLYVDSHEDFNNSGKNWLSRVILHSMFNRHIVKKALPYIDKVLYVAYENVDFLTQMYRIPMDMLEFYPLGGTIIKEEERTQNRNKIRAELGLAEDDILLVHSGKLDKLKRTEDVLQALAEVKRDKLRLVIFGSIPEDMKPILEPRIKTDTRVSFLGWKTADELLAYLCAADLYVQPGSQSATMQSALCCGCPVLIDRVKSHKPFMRDTGWYGNSKKDLVRIFEEICGNPGILKEKSRNAAKLAGEMLDYRKLAARLYR